MTEKLRNIEAAWSDVFLKKKKRVFGFSMNISMVSAIIRMFTQAVLKDGSYQDSIKTSFIYKT